MESATDKSTVHSGLVWILSGSALALYGFLGLMQVKVPGVEDAVAFFSSVDGVYLWLAACTAIFFEGLYFFGSFFPGTTLVVVIAILSQVGGLFVFLGTIASIFIGWCLAGVVNIVIARVYHITVIQTPHNDGHEVRDRMWTTWFPIFRANYEVSQIAEGGKPYEVFLSSVRVKFLVSLMLLGYTLVLPLFIDIHTLSNEEGFLSLAVIAGISFVVGIVKIKNARQAV